MECPSCLAWVAPPDTLCDCGEVVRHEAGGPLRPGGDSPLPLSDESEAADPPSLDPAEVGAAEEDGREAEMTQNAEGDTLDAGVAYAEEAEPAVPARQALPLEPPTPAMAASEEGPWEALGQHASPAPEARREGPPAAPLDSGTKPRRKRITPFRYHGEVGTLFKLQAINMCLRFLTLGVYSFWARARFRRYVFGQLSYRGQRFAWHGTGREGLMGFLRLAGIFLAVAGVLAAVGFALSSGTGGSTDVLPALQEAAGLAPAAFQVVLVLIFPPLAVVAGRRYLLSRTSLNGVHFSFRGTYAAFFRILLPQGLLLGLTLGLSYPVLWARLNEWLWNHTWYGNRRFHCEVSARDVYGSFLLALLLSPLTLGLSFFWFSARRRRILAAGITLGRTRFRSGATGFALLKMAALQVTVTVLTLGLASAWAKTRTLRYLADQTAVVGSLDLHEIRQETLAAEATADGLLDDSGLDALVG